jgi:flagellin
LVSGDRAIIQDEMNALVDEVDRIATQTEFNTQPLLDTGDTFAPASNNPGPFSGTFHIGANKGQTHTLTINDMGSDGIGVNSIDVESQSASETSIETIDAAIDLVNAERAALGALTNRFEATINNLTTTSENTSAAESRIRDVDMAKEMMNFTKNNILSQAAQAMLAQANQLPQGVLQLLR